MPGRALRGLAPNDPLFALAGERLAARELVRAGLQILARRLRTPWAELDLVGREGATLVVVEVKTGRAGPRFRPAMRVRAEALARLERAARGLARGAPWRVDVLEVRLEDGRVECVHLRDFRQPL
jgi:putative endonuclease